jgi:serine protease AprX
MDNHEIPNDDDYRFNPEILDKTIIAIPLLKEIEENPDAKIAVIIDLNLNYKGGRAEARSKIITLLSELMPGESEDLKKTRLTEQYVFTKIPADLIKKLIKLDDKANRAIFKIWPDFKIQPQTTKSVSTIKADAARSSFSALGEEITWAVVDSGINFSHPHFLAHDNRCTDYHMDFTGNESPFEDEFGHGTHVAGIIAGELIISDSKATSNIFAVSKSRDEDNNPIFSKVKLNKISGMAPKCKLVSLKVLDDLGEGNASSLIAAIGHIQEVNNFGRDIKIHGVNLSLGYSFDPEWFACGQSPLCIEVNRLVKSGVVVVAAAGNTGYGYVTTKSNGRVATGMPLSINDPGNAELAITVGSTHREMPHTYGVSFFSSKGPTGDGRLKPDLVAPGEKIISCAVGNKKKQIKEEITDDAHCYYLQDSGTSMAAPHVSGAIAAFLSIRREYIGQPEKIKAIFTSTATDLKRDKYFQGNGLLDLMRAIQSI